MPYKFNVFTKKLDYYEPSSSGGGGSQITSLSLIFCESFVGDGGTTTFTLSGSLENAAFSLGSWSYARVGQSLPSHVTNTNNKALYDGTNLFTKTRIQVDSINGATAEVTLTEPPQFLQEFKIWYWYTLKSTDVLSYYRREEFVASMEGDITSGDTIAGQNVSLNTTNFTNILSSSEDTSQKAFDLLDKHEHGTIITDTLIDDLDLDNFYIGYAIQNGSVNDPLWQIKKVVETVTEEIEFYYADGSEDFDKTWSSRSSYTYN